MNVTRFPNPDLSEHLRLANHSAFLVSSAFDEGLLQIIYYIYGSPYWEEVDHFPLDYTKCSI
jgi:hypothetical protein